MAHSERDEARDAYDIASNSPTEENPTSNRYASNDVASRPPLFAGMKQRQYGGGGGESSTATGTRTSEEIISDYRRKNEERKQRATLQIGLKEAYRRTGENGGFISKTGTSTAATTDRLQENMRSTKSPERMAESRIPISSAYSPQPRPNFGNERSSSPPRANAYSRARIESRGTPAPEDSGSDSTGPREGSPSPAPGLKDRTRRGRERNGSPAEDLGISNARRTSTQLDREDYVARAIANSHPLFVKKPAQENTSIFASRRGVGPKVAETTKTLEKKTSTSSLEGVPEPGTRETGTRVAETAKTLARKTSTGSFEDSPEPPIRVPKSWGARAKNTSGAKWMARILSPDPSMDMKDFQPDVGGQQGQLSDVPLPTIEDVSSLQEPTPPSSRPSSAHPKNGSPEKSKLWDADLDFTAQSLQVSMSPQLRVRNTKLDEIRDREIQSLTARALASNRLEEIKERNSEERTILSETSPINDRESIPAAKQGKNENVVENFKREDSFETLRALSRVLSVSPAPPSRRERGQEVEKADNSDKKSASLYREDLGGKGLVKTRVPSDTLKVEDAKAKRKSVEIAPETYGFDVEVDSRRRSRASSPKSDADDPEERITAEARLFELQDNKSERNSIREVSPSSEDEDDGKVEETPRPKIDPQSRPTPRVTGAYIETPLPTVRKSRHTRSNSLNSPVKEIGVSDFAKLSDYKRPQSTSRVTGYSDERHTGQAGSASSRQNTSTRPRAVELESRPPLINSANPTTAAEDLRRLKEEGNYEDSTLDLGVLIEAETQVAAQLQANKNALDTLPDLNYDEKGRPLSDAEKKRRLESITLDRMNQHLKNTSSSIRDARQGIERLEHQVSAKTWEITHQKDNKAYLMIPAPRIWTRSPPSKTSNQSKSKPKWKLTWFGFILFLLTGWYAAELVTCSIYCHPSQSLFNNNWQLSDPFFSWAIPTKLDQLTGEVFSNAAHGTLRAVEDFFGLPYRDGRPYPAPLSADDWWLGRGGPSPIVDDTTSEDASFLNDEIL